MAQKKWWEEGIRFECQGSGKCCLSRGEYGFVYLTLNDRKRLAAHLKLNLSEFTKRHCKKKDGFYHLLDPPGSPACVFLDENKRCRVYEARPTQCRTWPFWPEAMNAKTWAKEVKAFCPGVGKGKIVPAEEIRKILNDQSQADKQS